MRQAYGIYKESKIQEEALKDVDAFARPIDPTRVVVRLGCGTESGGEVGLVTGAGRPRDPGLHPIQFAGTQCGTRAGHAVHRCRLVERGPSRAGALVVPAMNRGTRR